MKAFVNWPMLEETKWDSGSLTVLSAVIHSFSEPGDYMGTIFKHNEIVRTFQLSVDKKYAATQVDLDLAQGQERGSEGCSRAEDKVLAVNEHGFALFFASRGRGGYSVQIGRLGKDGKPTLVFDSRQLKKGDMFAVTLIRPGTYTITNVTSKAAGKIVVAYPEIRETPYRPLNAVTVECAEKSFSPDQIRLGPAQGHVYQIKSPARIQIELVEPNDGPSGGKRRATKKR